MWPASWNGSHETAYSSRPTTPGRIAARTRSSESRHSAQKLACSSDGSPPPATKLRVMSAQQREALSRGQMSTMTGAPRAIGPEPDSCPCRLRPEDTMTSSGSSASRSSQTACIAAARPRS